MGFPKTSEDVPAKYRAMYQRAMTGRCRKDAIRVHCLMCVGWNQREVELCTAPKCPMYPYRLGKLAGKDASKKSNSRKTGGQGVSDGLAA